MIIDWGKQAILYDNFLIATKPYSDLIVLSYSKQ